MLKVHQENKSITDKLDDLKKAVQLAQQSLAPKPIFRVIQGGKANG
jgi:hypothetical protein